MSASLSIHRHDHLATRRLSFFSHTVDATKLGEGKDPQGGQRIGFETKFTIKRSEYDMDFMNGPIGDDVHITVALEGVKQ